MVKAFYLKLDDNIVRLFAEIDGTEDNAKELEFWLGEFKYVGKTRLNDKEVYEYQFTPHNRFDTLFTLHSELFHVIGHEEPELYVLDNLDDVKEVSKDELKRYIADWANKTF